MKNHYHSRLRKTLRKMNKCLSDHPRAQFHPLKNSLLSQIVQTAEDSYSRHGRVPHPLSRTALGTACPIADLKIRILAQLHLG